MSLQSSTERLRISKKYTRAQHSSCFQPRMNTRVLVVVDQIDVMRYWILYEEPEEQLAYKKYFTLWQIKNVR
jgi:hypothetical protein